jgi:hypothetical protein
MSPWLLCLGISHVVASIGLSMGMFFYWLELQDHKIKQWGDMFGRPLSRGLFGEIMVEKHQRTRERCLKEET